VVTRGGSAFGDNQYGANEKLPVPMRSAELICCLENGARDFLRILVGTRLYGVTSQARGSSVVTAEKALDFTCWGKPYCMTRDTDCPLAFFTVYSAYLPCVYRVTLLSYVHFVIGQGGQ